MTFENTLCSMKGYNLFGTTGWIINILIIIALGLTIFWLIKKLNKTK